MRLILLSVIQLSGGHCICFDSVLIKYSIMFKECIALLKISIMTFMDGIFSRKLKPTRQGESSHWKWNKTKVRIFILPLKKTSFHLILQFTTVIPSFRWSLKAGVSNWCFLAELKNHKANDTSNTTLSIIKIYRLEV